MFGMVGALFALQGVFRQWASARLQPFLQARLGVLELFCRRQVANQWIEMIEDHPPAGCKTAIDEYRAQQGFEGIRQDRGAAEFV